MGERIDSVPKSSALVRSRRLYWALVIVLLLPLAAFWVSVVTQSATISRVLFGTRHTSARDLLPTVILPAITLVLSVARLRVSAMTAEERNVTRAVIAVITTSYLLILGYLISENAR